MSNMSYCRWENTAGDLQDCFNHIEDFGLNDYEFDGKQQIIGLARQIVKWANDFEKGNRKAFEDLDYSEFEENYFFEED